MTDYRAKLQGLLYELFQFDSADLDFGFYAVMNRKRDQVARFIEHDLLDAVQGGLQILAAESQDEARAALARAKATAINGLGEEAFDGDELIQSQNTPLGRAYLKAQETFKNATVSAEVEAHIFNDLYQFFARYYQDGDFISQRRYGRSDKYAVPYNGEEVHLHWANYDQYYVKTGTHFTNYSFTVPGSIGLKDGASVQVKIAKIDVERDNVKGDKRFFIFAEDQSVTWDEENQTLTIPFEYRALTPEESKRVGTRNQQDKLLAEAHKAIIDAVPNQSLRAQLTSPDTERKSDKDRLAYHLNRYAAENTRDFFVHKDLGGFLRRELDYFLKNEVIRLDDIDLDNLGSVRQAGARAKTMRTIGGKIIAFLEQLEAFQRRLFLKRKFVLQSDYCLTLDKIPADVRADFYPEILANARQLEEWKQLYGVEIQPDTDLSKHPHLMLDTAFFDVAFKLRLLGTFEDLDAASNGLLVHGENFQALSLLIDKYGKSVDCIYIDPPYNTTDNGFLYKNDYQHSSWNTMIENRLAKSRYFLTDQGVLTTAIDDLEMHNLGLISDSIFEQTGRLGILVVEIKPSGRTNDNFLATSHEYYLMYSNNPKAAQITFFPLSEEQKKQYSEQDEQSPYKWRDFLRTGGYSTPRERPNSHYPIYYLPQSGEISLEKQEGWIEIWPIDSEGNHRVWRKTPPSFLKHLKDNEISIIQNKDGKYKVQLIDRIKPGIRPKSVWMNSTYDAASHGTKLLRKLFGESSIFSFPKSIHATQDVLYITIGSNENAIVLDFFAGSGTTGHAVMNLNLEDEGERKYILVEMGEYFNTVLKPRIQKVAYSTEWKNGTPVPPKGEKELVGQSHMFQYMRLESYDDTFHNIRFQDTDAPQASLLSQMPDYLLSYFLEQETTGSPTLLDIAQFERPFEYQLLVTGQGGVLSPQPVDLVATFNFLLGLTVHTLRHFERSGQPYVRVTGTNPEGRKVCVVWRNVPPVEEMDAERDWLNTHVLANISYDKLYLNGESTLPDALSTEEEFKRRMFEGVH